MRLTIPFVVAATALLATPAFSQEYNYSSPSAYRVVASTAQIQAFTGEGSPASPVVNMRGVGIDDQGRLYVFSNSGSASGRLLRITDGGSGAPSFETLATAAELLPATGTPPAANISNNGVAVRKNGSTYEVYMGVFDGLDDILKVVPGVTPTVTNVRPDRDGLLSVAIDTLNDRILYTQTLGFGALVNDLGSVSLSSPGADVAVATDDAIAAATGSTQAALANLNCNVAVTTATVAADVNYYVWDEQAFGGSDTLLRITAGGAVSVVADKDAIYGAATSNLNAFIESVVVDDNGTATTTDDTLFILQSRTSGNPQHKLVVRNPNGTYNRLPFSQVNEALGRVTNNTDDNVFRVALGGAVLHKTPTKATLYLNERTQGGQGRIVALDYLPLTAPAAAGNWAAYE